MDRATTHAVRAPYRLAVNCHHLARNCRTNAPYPSHKARLELPRIKRCEYAPEGVMRGNPVAQRQVPAQPLQLALPPQSDPHPSVGTRQDRRQCNHQHFRQIMLRGAYTRILQVPKRVLQTQRLVFVVHTTLGSWQNQELTLLRSSLQPPFATHCV